jgi:hypothetical protein
MTHDPLCLHRSVIQDAVHPEVCAYCQLIAKVRADERQRSNVA